MHQMSQAFSIFKAFQVPDIRIPACSRQLAKPLSDSFSSTHLDQPVIFPETKSKKIGTASRDPHLIWRCRISLGSRTYAELANPSWQETPKHVEMGGALLWMTWGKNKLGVYQGFHKGKAGRFEASCTSYCTDPTEEPSPSKRVGEHSFLFVKKRRKPWKNNIAEE